MSENVAEVMKPNGEITVYASLKEAIAAVETTGFSTQAAPEKPTVVKLLADTNDGIDIGASGKLLQNVELDLNGKTLTLGPGIGSANTETNGIRVLSYSKLAVKNGTVVCSSEPYQALNGNMTYVKIGFANYGTLALDNVQVKSSEHVEYTINNRGALTLSGATSVESGGAAGCVAITNDVYNAHYADFDASLTVADPQVTVGKVLVERYADSRNGNAGSVVLDISAGAFDSIVDDGSVDVPLESNVTGGTFSSPPMSFAAEGFMIFQDESGSFYVAEAKDAEVSGTFYPTLLEALEKAPDGATIKLLRNVTIDASQLANPFYYEVSGKSITLDLNDRILTLDETNVVINSSDRAGTERGLFRVAADGGLTVKDTARGTITATAPASTWSTRPLIDVYGTFELSGGTVKGVENLYYLMGVNGPDAHMTISGGTLDNQWGTPKDGGVCLSSNGNAGNNGYVLDITGGTLKGGEQTLYLPSAGTTTISGDAVLEGTARAVEIRSGELNIAGGTFSSTAERIDDAAANNGATGSYTGAIVVVNPAGASATGYVGDVNVAITDGTFTSSGDALVVVNEQKADADPYYKVNTSVSGGEFTGDFNVALPSTSEERLAISGGTFSVDPAQYVSYGYEVAESDGVFTINAIEAVAATVNGQEVIYPSVITALDAVEGEVALKLLKDIEEDVLVGEGRAVTLDLAGHKLTSVKSDAILNAGTLVVTDSSSDQTGTVDGTMNGRAALLNTNTGKATIEGGTFTRSAEKGADGSANGNSWYTVKNEGDLTVSGGTIVNSSSYSSLVRNDGTMLVEGGTLHQDGIIAVNNYSTGEFEMTGGTIISKDDQGILNWNKAIVSGGTIDAKVGVVSMADSSDTGSTTIAGDVVINGNVHSVAYSNAAGAPSVSIEGGTINGTLQKRMYNKDDKTYTDVEADNASSKLVASGGTFSDDPTAFVADGYEAAKNAEGRYVVQKQGNQAAISDVEYPTLAEAVAAAKNGETVTMLKDAVFDSDSIVTVDAGKDVVLNLNGKCISTTSDFEGRPIVNRGTLTLVGDGAIDSSASRTGGYGALDNYGTLTVENGTYSGSVYASGAALKNRESGVVVINGGTFDGATCALYNEGKATVNGGSFDSITCNQLKDDQGGDLYSYAVRSFGELYFNDGSITGVQGALAIANGYAEVKGGTFTARLDEHGEAGKNCTYYALYVAGEYGEVEAHISGGSFTSEGRNACCLIGNDGDGGNKDLATAFISGGSFRCDNGPIFSSAGSKSGNPTITGGVYSKDVSSWAAEGYEGADNADEATMDAYPYAVQAMEYAQIGDVTYPSLEAAFAAVKGGETITVLKDTSMTEAAALAVEGPVTLDLAGHTVTESKLSDDKTPAILSQNDGYTTELAIVSTGAEGTTGTIDYSAGKGEVVKSYGKLTLGANVALIGNSAANSVSMLGADAEINGASITGGYCAVGLFNRNYNNVGTQEENPSANIVINNGSTLKGTFAISTNNLYSAGCTATVNGGTLETPYTGIYWAAEGAVTVNNGTIIGQTGIEMKMGDLVVNGGTISTVGNGKGGSDGSPDKPGSGGSTESGSGIYLAGKFYGAAASQSRESTRLTATINGGTISSLHGDAIAVYEGDKAVPFAPVLTIPADKAVELAPASGKQPVAYYAASGIAVPETRISALGIKDVEKHTVAYEGVEGWTNPNPTQITEYDIVAIAANPTKDDNTFKGWTVDPEAANKGDAFNVVLQDASSDVTLTAGWQAVAGEAKLPEPVENKPLVDDNPVIGTPASEKEAAETAAKSAAESLVKDVAESNEAKGVSADDVKNIQEVVKKATNEIVSTISVIADVKSESEVGDDAAKIKESVGSDAAVTFLDLKVKMVVEEKETSTANKTEVNLTEVAEPIPFAIKVVPSKLKNDDGSLKGVLITAVHDDKVLTFAPESVDYETGIITFYADKFSTYGVAITEKTAGEPTWNETIQAFYANGTPIVITENTGDDKDAHPTLITWGDKSKAVESSWNVFGGGHNDGRTFETTSVTMKGGTLNNVFGGGLHKSNVGTANVTIEGGTVASVSGGGAALLKDDGCGSALQGSYPSNKDDINNFVGTANVAISDGTVTSTVFGGGESISSVGAANVTITGGNLSSAWVTAGGANGYTGSATLDIQGGDINVVQGVNRGGMDEVSMSVTGGTIAKFYLGGETEDGNVTGTIGSTVKAIIGKNATVAILSTGTSGGADIAGQNISTELSVENPASVGNFAEFIAADANGNVTVDATIDLSDTNTVKLSPDSIAAQPYAAQAVKPAVSVLVNGVELDSSRYTVTYENNVLPGTATITVRGADYVQGKANVKGTATTTFQITPADKTALNAATAAAKTLQSATVASTNGSDVANGSYWAPSSVVNAFNAAIVRADYCSTIDAVMTQKAVNDALAALNAATSTFNSARKQAVVSKTSLVSKITEAKNLRAATVSSSNGSNVAPTTYWATPVALAAYDSAIAAADGVRAQTAASQATVDMAISNLASATTTFNSARKLGTKTDVVAGTAVRLAGNVATGTAQVISSEGFKTSSTVVLARNDGFHDAMSATGLAGAYNCPILLTETNSLSSEAATEIKRLGATKVFIIGGTAAVSAQVENQVKALGASTERLAGSNAPDTSVKCAAAIVAKTGGSSNAIIATSDTFQDALSVSTFANKYKVPILLLDSNKQVISGAKQYLNAATKIYVPGGTAAVPASATDPYGSKIVRLAGDNAMDTSNKVAEYMVSSKLLSDATVGVANGLVYNGVDALAGSALMGQKGGVMLLTDGTDGGGATIDQFLKSHAKNVSKAYVFGGTAVVTPTLYSKVELLIK